MKYIFVNIRVDSVANFGDKSAVIRTDFDRGGCLTLPPCMDHSHSCSLSICRFCTRRMGENDGVDL